MNKLIAAITLASITTLSACTTFDPYTGQEKTSATAKGAGIGAGAGALLAYRKNKDANSTDRRRRILQAAGVGAIAGGSVGYYMDSQEAKLRQQLRSSGVSVQRDGDSINLIMPGNITFDTNSNNLQSGFLSVLDSVVLVLNEFEKTIIVVSGHTDSTGSDSHNQTLSEERADSVSRYIGAKGVTGARIDTAGFGETQPIADNGTAEGRAQNRRVELTLIPITANGM